jgi:hypothetical protein
MYIKGDCDTEFWLAQSEAFSINPQDSRLVLKRNDNGRSLYKAIEGKDFAEQFKMYENIYYNYSFGETVDAIVQAILRKKCKVGEEQKSGEQILKSMYKEKHEQLLKDFCDHRKSNNPAEIRLYNVLFNIVRNEYDTVQNFIKSSAKI